MACRISQDCSRFPKIKISTSLLFKDQRCQNYVMILGHEVFRPTNHILEFQMPQNTQKCHPMTLSESIEFVDLRSLIIGVRLPRLIENCLALLLFISIFIKLLLPTDGYATGSCHVDAGDFCISCNFSKMPRTPKISITRGKASHNYLVTPKRKWV